MSNQAKTKSRRLAFGLLILFASGAFASATGCASLIGLEDRENDPDAVYDEETETVTRDQCVTYCDDVMANCTGDNKVYASRNSCINTCNGLPPGDPNEPFENNVQCRMGHAKGAASAPDEECKAAGPGGFADCGTSCQAWCHLLEDQCPEDFGVLDDCMESCQSIPDDKTFDVDRSYSEDSIQCRLIHLGAVAGDPASVHCTHGRYIPLEACVPPADGEPTCEEYCQTVSANCQGDDAVYDSDDECLAACAELPVGEFSDVSENTVGCRLYHAKASSQDSGTHCDHASPSGVGVCGAYDDDEDKTGSCESYCTLYRVGCDTEFAEEFTDTDDCISSCVQEFDDRGARDGGNYSTKTAPGEDTLQCRTYYSVKALGGAEADCGKAKSAGTCD